jgi:hypothetical protein
MIYSSLAVLAMSASALVNPFTHLHTKPAVPDTRVSITLRNQAVGFRDVKIGGHIYTIQANHSITIKAPVGTVVYAASPITGFHRGDPIVDLTPDLNSKAIKLN